jgi:translocation and assembly module TamB
LGGGTVSASGYVDLYLNQLPSFNVALNLNNNRVKFFPVNLAEFENARLTFTGNKPPYLFSGTAKARKILMRKNFDIGDSSKRRTSKYLPEKISGDKGFYEVKIKATADNNIIVQNDLLDAEFRGEVTLLNNFEFPQIIGRGELVKGKLLFRNAVFSLDHAVVRLNNPEIFEPQFSIGGQANVDAYKISIFASGTTDSNKITLSSNPSLPQEDILSLLAFGIRGDDAKRVSPDDLTAITYTEVGSILLEQLKINKDLQSKGFKLSVTPHVSDNEANIIRPRSVSEVASPKVLVQKRVFSNLDATLGSTFGSAQTQDLDASLEYHFNKRVSIDGVYEQKQTLEAAEKDSSYGADLKFKWGFK